MEKKKVLIINTGGTIGMTQNEKGLVPDKEFLHEALEHMDALKSAAMPCWTLIDLDNLLDSSNMSVSDWNKIGQLIYDNYSMYDGFVVLHGTDTMAYTASALSFMLENLNKPVVLTGSQIPLCEVRSDARDNIITSLLIASNDKVREVCICFGGKLLRGNRAMKYSADELIAFVTPNYPSLADIGIEIKLDENALLKKSEGSFSLQLFKEIPIGVLKIFPGIQFSLFESIMTESLKGIVIETFGTGNIPNTASSLLPIIDKAFKNGTIVVVCTQCPHGTVQLGIYETSSALKEIGAVSGLDMTTEAAVAKLYYLFSKDYEAKDIKVLMEQNLRGEMKN